MAMPLRAEHREDEVKRIIWGDAPEPGAEGSGLSLSGVQLIVWEYLNRSRLSGAANAPAKAAIRSVPVQASGASADAPDAPPLAGWRRSASNR